MPEEVGPVFLIDKGEVMAKNLEVDQNTITLYPRTPATWVAVIYTVIFLGIAGEGVKELFRAVGEGRGPIPALIALTAFTLIWAFLLRNYGSRVIFDTSARVVHKKTVFGYKELMGFDAIDSIAPVIESHQCVGKDTYYKISVLGDRYGKGVRLTPSMPTKDREKFENEDLPVLLERLGLSGPADGPAAALSGQPSAVPAGPPEDTVSYRRNGSAYSLPFRSRLALLLAVTAGCILGGLATAAPDNRLLLLFVAGVVFLMAFFTQTSLVLDIASRTMTLRTCFGLRKKVYSFDDFEGLSSTRQIINFFPSGTFLHMRVANRKTPIFLGLAYLSAKKLNRIGEETERIIEAGLDPA